MFLCKTCNAANGNFFPEGNCYVCNDGFSKTEKMLGNALELAMGAESFSVSTMLPKDWLAREEKAWDQRISESIKNHINRMLISRIAKAGMECDKEGEIRLIFDYTSGEVSLQRNELFIFGRYRKISAGLSQSRWICSSCEGRGCHKCEGKGKFYESVEERIGEPLKAACSAENYILHASGREDVDATNSAGRPFVMELKGAQKRNINLDEISRTIAAKNDVSVHDLRIVPRSFVEIVTESHFDKAYEAEVEFEKGISESDAEKIRALEGKTLLQQTPARVSHRRADLVRHRKVKHVEVVNVKGNRAMLIIKAEAGTYIKELISGDNGRTKPSVSEILGFGAVCKKLNVSMIDDQFMDFCLESRT